MTTRNARHTVRWMTRLAPVALLALLGAACGQPPAPAAAPESAPA